MDAELVIAGRIKCAKESEPKEGRIPSFAEKRIISINPSQNGGMDMKPSPKTVVRLSIQEYCLTAERIPRGRPMIVAKKTLRTASFAVVGKRLTIFHYRHAGTVRNSEISC